MPPLVVAIHVILKFISEHSLDAAYVLFLVTSMAVISNPFYSQINAFVSSEASFHEAIDLLFTMFVLQYSFVDIFGLTQIKVSDRPFSRLLHSNHIDTSNMRYFAGISIPYPLPFVDKVITNFLRRHLLIGKQRSDYFNTRLLPFSLPHTTKTNQGVSH